MELFAADGHDAGGCERVTGKSGMRPIQVQGCTDRAFAEAGVGGQRAGAEVFDDAGGVGSAV